MTKEIGIIWEDLWSTVDKKYTSTIFEIWKNPEKAEKRKEELMSPKNFKIYYIYRVTKHEVKS